MSPTPVCIETNRLVLRAPLEIDDASAVAAFQSRNREHFCPWDPTRAPSYFTAAHWRDQLLADAEEFEVGRRVRFFVSPKDAPDQIIAFAHFANIVRGAFWACHLGFGVDREHQGTGVMHEALSACVARMFEDFGLHRIEANHRPENVRSAALLRRLDFVPQGYARDYLRIDGDWRDHVLTAATNERWTAPAP